MCSFQIHRKQFRFSIEFVKWYVNVNFHFEFKAINTYYTTNAYLPILAHINMVQLP